jgi:Spy/CpxP family protein refolding chaperone
MYSIKRIISAVAVVSMFSMALFAQGQSRIRTHNGANAGKQTQRLAVLAKALNLSDAQVTSIRAAVQSERPALKTMLQDVKARRQALKGVAGTASPDATAVGNAFLALRSSEGNLKAERQKLHANIRSILTPEQQKSMDALKVVAQARFARFHRFGGESMATGS